MVDFDSLARRIVREFRPGGWPAKEDELAHMLRVSTTDPRIGHVVVKTTGDYTFEGVVTAVIPKRKGGERFAVEDDRGLILIMNAKQCASTSRT